MITVRDFTARIKEGKNLVAHISFDLAQGKVLGVYGPNGAGKSTLLRGIGHMTYQRATTEYSISGNTLTVADLATLNAGFGQSSFEVNLQGATHQGTLSRASQKQLRNSTGESLYSTFCPTEQSLVQ